MRSDATLVVHKIYVTPALARVQQLVVKGHVRGWDDPRLPTLAGMRRRGLTPEGIRLLCHELGITRSDNAVALHKVYHHVRSHLDETSPRALAVLWPLRIVRARACAVACARSGQCSVCKMLCAPLWPARGTKPHVAWWWGRSGS
jgi:tRNA synthetases class I (E and Q), catalytic domain